MAPSTVGHVTVRDVDRASIKTTDAVDIVPLIIPSVVINITILCRQLFRISLPDSIDFCFGGVVSVVAVNWCGGVLQGGQTGQRYNKDSRTDIF